ncbi:MAG: hypothetical protein ABI769_05770 [Pseudomonadota bacterium]
MRNHKILWLGALALATPAFTNTSTVRRWSEPPVSTDQYESHPMFDPRSGDLYFVRSTPEFEHWKLLVSACDRDGRRGEPEPPPFASPAAAEADPFFTRDGGTFYFISTRSVNGEAKSDLDIWRVHRDRSGVWAAPEHLPAPVNSDKQEWFPRLAADGWLYFGSGREGGLGRTDIWRAKEVGGVWRVENLGREINTAGDEFEPELSANGKHLLLMADDDLYGSRLEHGRWTLREKLGPEVNTANMEVGSYLSPDARSFLFSRDGEIYQYGSSAQNFPPHCRRR